VLPTLPKKLMMLALSLEMMPSRLEELKLPMISIMSLRLKYNSKTLALVKLSQGSCWW